MAKKKPAQYNDEWYEPPIILGVGQYQRIGATNAKTKMKAPIGFIRPKVKASVQRPVSKRK